MTVGGAPGLVPAERYCRLPIPHAMGIDKFNGHGYVGHAQSGFAVCGPSNAPGRFFYFKEGIMLEVTQPAVQQIAEYFKGKEVKPIRIFLNEGG